MSKIALLNLEKRVVTIFKLSPEQQEAFFYSWSYMQIIELARDDNWVTLERVMNEHNYFSA